MINQHNKNIFIFIFVFTFYNLFAPGINNDLIILKQTISGEQIMENIYKNTRVNLLKRVYVYGSQLEAYKAKNNLTFCNVMVKDIMDGRPHPIWKGYGFLVDDLPIDVSSVFPSVFDILSFTIKIDWQMADRAYRQGKIERLTPEQAQREANEGYVVWIISILWNHEALVFPDDNKYNEDKGPLIVQAGGKDCNGVMYITDKRAFGWRYAYYQDSIRFYKFNWGV